MEKLTIRFLKTKDDNDKVIYTLNFNANEDGSCELRPYYDEKDHLKNKQKIIECALSLGYSPESKDLQEFINGTRNDLDAIKR